jgi:TPR repeat protein
VLNGVLYLKGHGVPQDNVEANRWFRSAAEQGDAEGQLRLALAFWFGIGVAQDYVQALMWSALAAAQSNEEARIVQAAISKKMTPAQIDTAQRLALQWKPKKM